MDLDIPIIDSILASNARHLDWAMDLITARGRRNVGLLGLSFKPETDDLRESPNLALAERLLGKGYGVMIFDPIVQISQLVGANRDYVLNQIPHISQLLVESIDEVLDHADLLVIGTAHPVFRAVLDRVDPSTEVVDLVGLVDGRPQHEGYFGIGW
jgi:GDP-mannose 6-dehydrogenase